ncbi:hypothetical protein GCM10009104_02290 [Marinobacterium maritimum]|uniref:DUF4064 domain-containing protein n=1 Tax=Marinobacterium maritimum TaxID=500162 RepID=A0ABP3T656_9GAMM
MNVFLRILVGAGGVLVVLFGLFFLGGGQMLESLFASNGALVDASMFTYFAFGMIAIGALGCWGSFGNKKIPAGIFCGIMLLGWPIGTIYAVVCFVIMMFARQGNTETEIQEQAPEQA